MGYYVHCIIGVIETRKTNLDKIKEICNQVNDFYVENDEYVKWEYHDKLFKEYVSSKVPESIFIFGYVDEYYKASYIIYDNDSYVEMKSNDFSSFNKAKAFLIKKLKAYNATNISSYFGNHKK